MKINLFRRYFNVSILGADTIQSYKILDQLGMDITLIKLSQMRKLESMPVVLRWKVIDEIKNNVQIIDIEELIKQNMT